MNEVKTNQEWLFTGVRIVPRSEGTGLERV